MAASDMSMDAEGLQVNEKEMWSYESRLKTYNNWPFGSNCSCTPSKMAAAGFFACGDIKEVDLAKCFVCLKELDGWRESDIPMEEHRAHSPTCKYVLLNKQPDDINIYEYLELFSARQNNQIIVKFKKLEQQSYHDAEKKRRRLQVAIQQR